MAITLGGFTYPENFELQLIEQDKLPVLAATDPIFTDFPIVVKEGFNIGWEQRDNFIGLQSARGLNGAPSRVKHVGGKRFSMEPGVYGDFYRLDEKEITERARYGTLGIPANIDDLIMEGQDILLSRRFTRIRQIIWNALQGSISVANASGQVIVTDTFAVQTLTANVPWATYATATPLGDFRAAKLKARGHSVAFDSGAKAYMSQETFNLLIQNTNANDIAGRRTSGLSYPLNLEEVNRIFMGEGLPQIVIQDDTYFDDAGALQLYIPKFAVIIVGRRQTGAVLGEYRMVSNANNPSAAAGPYTIVDDSAAKNEVPRKIDVHDGHNGGPVVYYPSGVICMTVGS